MFDVIGLGFSTIDLLAMVDHFPNGDDLQRTTMMTMQGGGPVATAIVTLARLGAQVAMLDALGDDWRGKMILEEYQQENVCTSYIQMRPGYTSALSSIWVKQGIGERSGERAIVYALGNAPELTPDEIPQPLIASAKYLHVNGRHWPASLHAVEYAHQAGGQVSFDGGAGLYRPEVRTLVPQTDICIVALEFARQYTGATQIEPAAQALLSEGPGLVVITSGVQGSWVFSKEGESFHQPATLFPQVVDTTGCGDAYHGAFLFGLLQGFPLKKTTALASLVAGMNSRALGGRTGLPTYEQMRRLLPM
jgi:sulfofructose kinase